MMEEGQGEGVMEEGEGVMRKVRVYVMEEGEGVMRKVRV